LTEEVAAVMLTHVDYRTGRVHDMKAITRQGTRGRCLMIWDLAHSAGALPVDLAGLQCRYRGGLHLQISQWRSRRARPSSMSGLT
jgi:kynureninase